jgi:hypothetical protein
MRISEASGVHSMVGSRMCDDIDGDNGGRLARRSVS